MAELILGAVALGIQVADSSITVLRFINEVVVNTKHYGDQVTALRSRISAETARVDTFLTYLKNKTPNGQPKLATLHASCQSAVVCLIQELEVTFAAFTSYIQQHDIDALRRGYALNIDDDALDKVLDAKLLEIKRTKGNAPRLDRLAWSLFQKRKVLRLVATLQSWNDSLMNVLLCDAVFGPDGVTVRPQSIQDPVVDAGLSLKAILDKQDPSHATSATLIDSTATLEQVDRQNRIATLSQVGSDGSHKKTRVFVEFKSFELKRRATEPSDAVKARVENLARLLAHKDAHKAGFNALHCIAVIKMPAPEKAFAFAFELPNALFPATQPPISLLSAISSRTVQRPTLNERFAIARAVVKTVFQLHSVDWLHKSIRSENVLFGFHGDPSAPNYTRPLLVGFEFSRLEKDRSTTEQDGRLDRNIYRHPDRQGLPEDRFNSLHDIYALGVVLLEIGLWRLAVGFENDFSRMEAHSIMQSLQEHARDRLPHYMGVEYTEAVLACLECSLLADRAAPTVAAGLTDAQRLDLNMSLLENVLNKFPRDL